MTFDELYKSNHVVRAICDEAKNPKPFGPDFCRGELLHGMRQDRGQVGLYFLIEKNVPLEYQDMVKDYCRDNAPACRRADCTEANCSRFYLKDDLPADHTEIFASAYLKLTPEQKNSKKWALKRDPQLARFDSLITRLREAGKDNQ
jgi:hypothetical protein